MSDTIREKIIGQIMDRLATIKVSAGYNTDIGENVLRVRRSLDSDELPGCVLWPLPEVTEQLYGRAKCTMPVKITAFAEFGAVNPSVVSEKILGDLIKCLTAPSWTRTPEYISDLAYSGGGSDEYPEEGETVIGTHGDFTVVYETKNGDPYSQ
ncbi:MAG: hypothetical protein JXI32_01870 [Deltaproteobacteria bacterium]|nr:hypothetical protein [Deltaproteobacteria bacterium]